MSESNETLPAEGPITFDRVRTATTMGMDPTGSQPIDDTLVGVEEGTLIQFPEGTYQLAAPYTVTADRIGFIGTDDVTLRLPEGHRSAFIICDGPDEFLFDGIDVDMRGDRSGHMRIHCPSRFYVDDVAYLGRGRNTGYAFNVAVTNQTGTGILRNVRIPHGSRIDGYNDGDGRIGVWAGLRHNGTLRVENCDMREFGNNALYTSRTSGDVQVVGSQFVNNSPASIRISGDGSFARRCTVRFDLGSYTGPPVRRVYNARGVVIEQKSVNDVPFQQPGAFVERCQFAYLDTAEVEPNAQGVIDVWGPSHTLDVRNTTIRVDTDGVPAVRRENPVARKPHRPSRQTIPEPHWLRLDGVTILGAAATGAAVRLTAADGCRVVNSRIVQSGEQRDGIVFEKAAGGRVADSTIAVTGRHIVADESAVRHSGVRCHRLFDHGATATQE